MRICDRVTRYDACVRMRKVLVLSLFPGLVLGCGALLGSSSDDVEPPIRNNDADAGRREDSGEDSSREASDDASSVSDATTGDAVADADAAADAAAPRDKVVFVTSERYAGGFGTKGDADLVCTALARAANSALFGSSTFKAYLAGANNVSAATRITDRVYARMDGKVVFAPGPQTNKTPSDFVAIDEKGIAHSNDSNKFVWTGEATGVAAVDRTCADWTSSAGTAFGGFGDLTTTTTWGTSTGATAGCNELYRLYCFEE